MIYNSKISQKINKNLVKGLTFLCCFHAAFTTNFHAQNDWEKKYDLQKNQVQNKLDSLNGEMSILNQNLLATNQKKNTLAEQKASIGQVIEQTKRLLEETKEAIKVLNEQVLGAEKEIEQTNAKIGLILVDIQSKNKTPLEILLSSRDFAQTVSEIASLNSLNDQLKEFRQELAAKKEALENAKKIQEQTKKNQEGAQALNNSKKAELELLIAQTQNDEAKYQQYLNTLENQKLAFNVELKNIDNAKNVEAADIEKKRQEAIQKAEEERKKAEAIAIQHKNSNTNTGGGVKGISNNFTGQGSVGAGGWISCSVVNETTNVSGIPSGVWVNPASGYITSGFGCGTGVDGAHDGIDIANGMNTPIYAATDGVIIKASFNGGYGNNVVIKHTFANRTIYTNYGHLNVIQVSVGDRVKAGEQIGLMGTTGYSTGVHLHFSVSDESYEKTRNSNCNLVYGGSATDCYNPMRAPFNFFSGYPRLL